MPLDIIVGGQYGGEGKGNVSAYLSWKDNVDIIVKTGGPNSAHTFGSKKNGLRTLRMIPAGAAIGHTNFAIPAGALINVSVLFEELETVGFKGDFIIDPAAGIVEDLHVEEQKDDPFYKHAGSTLTGTGSALSYRAKRRLRQARNIHQLKPYLSPVSEYLSKELKQDKKVVIEGSQGFMLSNFHGDYPFTTSRDTISAAFLSQCGLPPQIVGDVILVVKVFPTRNSMGKGKLSNELGEEFVNSHMHILAEYGGGTYGQSGELRRTGLFDFEMVKKAARINGATGLALTGIDRLEELMHLQRIKEHYGTSSDFFQKLQDETGVPIIFTSEGRFIEDIADRRELSRI